MITLNLISPAQKAANNFRSNYSILRQIALIFLIAFVFVIGVLFLAQALLQNKLEDLTENTLMLKQNIEDEESIDLEKSVDDFNKMVLTISKVQTEYTAWTKVLVDTASLVPSGVAIGSFTLNKETAEFRFTGRALTRDLLLQFKENLEGSGFFTEIQSPISNLLTKENVGFEFSGKLVIETD